jgi:predicted DNA-binding transcriptional regulator YafY
MRSDRLLALLLMLQTRRRWSAPELSRRLEVSVRTIYRDVEALSAAGVPVYTERGRNGRIAILPDFRTDVTGMTEDEASALFVALDGAAHAQLGIGPALQSALRKVFTALPSTHRSAAAAMTDKLYIDQAGWGAANPGPPHFAEMQRAVFEQRRVVLTYEQRDSDEPRRIEVDPYGLVTKSGAWYLVGDVEGSPRMFRVDRVYDVEIVAEPAKLRPGIVLRDLWVELLAQFDQLTRSLEIVIRLDRAEYGLFLRVHGKTVVGTVTRDDPPLAADGSGRVELTLRMQSVGASRVLLAYGAALDVVSPPRCASTSMTSSRDSSIAQPAQTRRGRFARLRAADRSVRPRPGASARPRPAGALALRRARQRPPR